MKEEFRKDLDDLNLKTVEYGGDNISKLES